MLRHLRDRWDPTSEGRIPKELPVLLIRDAIAWLDRVTRD